MAEMIPLAELKQAVLESPATDATFGKAGTAAAFAVSEMFAMGDQVRTPAGTADWIKLYVDYVWAYAGIFSIAAAMSPLEPLLKKVSKETGEESDVPRHDCVRLLQKPNDSMTGLELMESLVVYMETCGMNYWEVVYSQSETVLAGKAVKRRVNPAELWTIRPDRLTPKPRKDGHGIETWQYQLREGGRKKSFAVDEIVPFRYLHPLNDWFGLGSLQPAVDDVLQDKQMSKWNLDFFKHGLTPEGILHTDKSITPFEMKSLGQQIKEFLSGKGRQVLILGKGLEWQTASLNPKDVEFLAGRKENRQAILAALGVPPVMVGLLEHAKYDNYALQLEAFHRDTIVPKVRRIEACLYCFYLPLWPELKDDADNDYRIEFDKSSLMLENEDRVLSREIQKISYGLTTPKAAAERLGLETEGVSEDYYMTSGLFPVTGAAAEAGLAAQEDQLTQAVGNLKAGVEGRLKKLEAAQREADEESGV